MLAQITINKGQGVLTQITRNKFSSMEGQRIFFWCGLTKITINKGKAVLAQIRRNIFFYKSRKTKMRCASAQITSNKDVVCAITNHNKQFFSMKGQGQKFILGWHKSQ